MSQAFAKNGPKRADISQHFPTSFFASQHDQNVGCGFSVSAENALKRPDISQHFPTWPNIVGFCWVVQPPNILPRSLENGMLGTACVAGRRMCAAATNNEKEESHDDEVF